MAFTKTLTHILNDLGVADAGTLLETPPNPELGEYALPCFTLAKAMHKSPVEIAKELATKIMQHKDAGFLARATPTGPYVNFFIKPEERANDILNRIDSEEFWNYNTSGKKIMIEYPSPNTNKPLHLGHVRNMVLGSTLAVILKHDGNTVIPVNLTNDRGVHICKSMLAYERWDNKEPNKKSDHFVGDYYVLFAKKQQEFPTLEEEAQAMLVKWEQGDEKTLALWKKMNHWALTGIATTYKRFNITFEKEYFESQIYKEGKDIVIKHLNVLDKDETGAVIANLERFKLPNKVLLRKDGTSIYMTQDIALTIKKMEEFHPDLQIWIVGNEQILHFQQLFAVLELFGVKGRESFYHLSYGMVSLPEGKMKSREGTVVDADDMLDELENTASEEIRARHTDWTEATIATTAKTVAMGAIRFFMIKYDPMRDFVFDPKSSLSFEGDTGPYLQYTHARICSVIAKAGEITTADVKLLVHPEEQELLRQIDIMPIHFRKAIDEYKPSAIANQLLEVGRAFNGFYHACPVLNAEPALRAARLALLDATRKVIQEGLAMLGITAPEMM